MCFCWHKCGTWWQSYQSIHCRFVCRQYKLLHAKFSAALLSHLASNMSQICKPQREARSIVCHDCSCPGTPRAATRFATLLSETLLDARQQLLLLPYTFPLRLTLMLWKETSMTKWHVLLCTWCFKLMHAGDVAIRHVNTRRNTRGGFAVGNTRQGRSRWSLSALGAGGSRKQEQYKGIQTNSNERRSAIARDYWRVMKTPVSRRFDFLMRHSF